jgi:prolyl oligopeptidase
MPAHSYKFAAAMQAAAASGTPVLLRVEKEAGHGAGLATIKQIESSADTLAFLLAALGAGG